MSPANASTMLMLPLALGTLDAAAVAPELLAEHPVPVVQIRWVKEGGTRARPRAARRAEQRPKEERTWLLVRLPASRTPVLVARRCRPDTMEPVLVVDEAGSAVEPKKKGRFLVMEQVGPARMRRLHVAWYTQPASLLTFTAARPWVVVCAVPWLLLCLSPTRRPQSSLNKSSSGANLPDTTKAAAVPTGKPPTAPVAAPVAALLPKLQELVDHSVQHQVSNCHACTRSPPAPGWLSLRAPHVTPPWPTLAPQQHCPLHPWRTTGCPGEAHGGSG